jgi:hypothetical protein
MVCVAKGKEDDYIMMQASNDEDNNVIMAFSSKEYANRVLNEVNAVYEEIIEVNMTNMNTPARIIVDIDTQNDKGSAIIQCIYNEIHNNDEYAAAYYENASLFATVMGPILATRYDDEAETAKTIVNTVYSFCLMYSNIVGSIAKDVNPEQIDGLIKQFEAMESSKEEGMEDDEDDSETD